MRDTIAFLLLVGIPVSATAVPVVIDFDTDASGNPIVAGQILDDEYSAFGVNISVVNDGGGPNLGVAFDTNNFTGGDDDLSHPFVIGNAIGRNYGNVLIIQEQGGDGDGDGIIDVPPDDEGSRPAGTMTFDLDFVTTEVSFTLLDVEEVGEFNGRGFFRAFLDGSPVHTTPWASLLLDETVVFGNHSANSASVRIPGGATRLVFDWGGSGAVGELVLERQLPEPGSLAVVGLGLLALVLAGRRPR